MGSIFFASWEDWSLGASFYFCFISLTTIGFGDLVPINTFVHSTDGLGAMLKMIFSLAYIVLGNQNKVFGF
jgi:hypothetical protein